ncbi:lipopolysaccharide biosynthesis protein [Fusobacterium necrophorum]|uniref:Polysaccharide biosynthesis protein C-terminal domain-containing protein n=1 Tax=Fusobacterium necrophorum DJ-2 TaxID=1441737 RepID=A0AB73C029_9FUSO|nr:polysaccharide biosynthesis C-terminal domain-containing protein [Fusobacterium necrophorum]KDE63561.1 hypothetical protein FUSO4_09180 [Fusobacterium necrophorum DJ-1]KDE67190.1 hypothetical protein FUSO5_00675 [Fusobacterium necrophorum BFTR-1]KDE69330.1 hypothetical protein FUSO8_11645 [Fusobacterium necrophorum DJ-2]MBR8823438.1 hypothetical protein [Fusobacterium necrophorum]MCF0163580.1 polysaccharide biosynthesis C-terminal domain-containing protein [Fusobacterium necrophorum]
MNKNCMFLNIFSLFLIQIILTIYNFLIPKMILFYYNSEVNGFILSLNQFLNYINIIEGGVSSVILAILYKPIAINDIDEVSAIIKATNRIFRKIGYILFIYTIILAVIYPYFITVRYNRVYIFAMTMVISFSIFVQYCFSLSYKLLLQAKKKSYIYSFSQAVSLGIILIISSYLLKRGEDLLLVKLVAGIIFFLHAFLFMKYTKKMCNIKEVKKENKNFIAKRWDGFGINIASFVHNNTDIVLISFFLNLKEVSVYSVYNLIILGIKMFISTISIGFTPLLGEYYAKKEFNKLNLIFDKYEQIILFVSFAIGTITTKTIIPFITLFTKNTTDVNYIRPSFGIIFIIYAVIFSIREPFINMSYVTGQFKTITKYAYIEASINIIMSLFLIVKFELNGVILATLFSTLYRTMIQIIFLENKILKRNYKNLLIKIIVFILLMCSNLYLAKFINSTIDDWIDWIIYSFKITIIVILVQSLYMLFYYRKFILGKGVKK